MDVLRWLKIGNALNSKSIQCVLSVRKALKSKMRERESLSHIRFVKTCTLAIVHHLEATITTNLTRHRPDTVQNPVVHHRISLYGSHIVHDVRI